MKTYDVHGKKLPIPSFFQVYNYGGGNGDKDREIVYAELTKDTPALINYYYINNSKYPHSFQSHEFDDLSRFERIGDVYNNIRSNLINEKKEIYSEYSSDKNFDFNDKVFLLDSGAANIVNSIAKDMDYKYENDRFSAVLIEHMKDYYDFADKLKVDIVVGFDLGGKYTEKAGEKKNRKLLEFLKAIDREEINKLLLEKTAEYLKTKKDYYPYVLATTHGNTPDDYKNCIKIILDLERKHNYKFWGFALGGIASYKQLEQKWFEGISFKDIKKNDFAPLVGPAVASRIVRMYDKERPIHALGCGGYSNIVTNYFCGATSFDSASPVRRVGDGGRESAKLVNNDKHYNKGKPGFSQYFVGEFNCDGSFRDDNPDYINLNEVADDLKMCGCPACNIAKTIANIKSIYAMKVDDTKEIRKTDKAKANRAKEAFFYSRQLMGLHAVYQHRILCEKLANTKCDSVEAFCNTYTNDLNIGISKVYNQLK